VGSSVSKRFCVKESEVTSLRNYCNLSLRTLNIESLSASGAAPFISFLLAYHTTGTITQSVVIV